MHKKIKKFDDTEIEERRFYQHKSLVLINDIDVDKIVVSNKEKLEKHEYVVANKKKCSNRKYKFDEIEIYSDK